MREVNILGTVLVAIGNLILRLCMPKRTYDYAWKQLSGLMLTIRMIVCMLFPVWILLLSGVYVCGKNLMEHMNRYSPEMIQSEIMLMVQVVLGPPLVMLLIRLLLMCVEWFTMKQREKNEKISK